MKESQNFKTSTFLSTKLKSWEGSIIPKYVYHLNYTTNCTIDSDYGRRSISFLIQTNSVRKFGSENIIKLLYVV